MKTRFLLAMAAFFALVAGALAQTSTSVTYKYTKVDFPGATSTEANSINNGNVIVGSYIDSSGLNHGFQFANGTFTTISFPGAAETAVLGINDLGDMVGWYKASIVVNPPHTVFCVTTEPSPQSMSHSRHSAQRWWASTSQESSSATSTILKPCFPERNI